MSSRHLIAKLYLEWHLYSLCASRLKNNQPLQQNYQCTRSFHSLVTSGQPVSFSPTSRLFPAQAHTPTHTAQWPSSCQSQSLLVHLSPVCLPLTYQTFLPAGSHPSPSFLSLSLSLYIFFFLSVSISVSFHSLFSDPSLFPWIHKIC